MARTLTDARAGAFSVLVLGVVAVLAACDKPSAPAPPRAAPPAPSETLAQRGLARERVERGAALYAANCAACHGANAEGAPNWHRPGPDGKYPAPPLNGTAHDWHHPMSALKQTIREGTGKLGSMPAWKDRLSEDDIEAAIAWFQSRWPEDVYKSWALMDERSGAGK